MWRSPPGCIEHKSNVIWALSTTLPWGRARPSLAFYLPPSPFSICHIKGLLLYWSFIFVVCSSTCAFTYSLLVYCPGECAIINSSFLKIVPKSCHPLMGVGVENRNLLPLNLSCRDEMCYRCCLMSCLMWWEHELVRSEHVYTCPSDQSQGNAWRKVVAYRVQRCVSVKRFGQGVVEGMVVFPAG